MQSPSPLLRALQRDQLIALRTERFADRTGLGVPGQFGDLGGQPLGLRVLDVEGHGVMVPGMVQLYQLASRAGQVSSYRGHCLVDRGA